MRQQAGIASGHHPSRRGCSGPNLTVTQVTPGNRPERRTATRTKGCRDSGKDSRQPAAVKGGMFSVWALGGVEGNAVNARSRMALAN
jgi:hypothetical protein